MKSIKKHKALVVRGNNNQAVIQLNTKEIERLFDGKNNASKDVSITDPVSKRSIEQNKRFWGHLMHLNKHLKKSGIEWSIEEAKQRCLLEACSIPEDELLGGCEYPYTIIDGVLYPLSTSDRTVKEMMTACQGVLNLGNKYMCYDFPERWVND